MIKIVKLLLASHNRGKLNEMSEMLKPFNIEVVSAADLHMADVEEKGTTFEENARLKAENLAKMSGFVCLADDSGLWVDCLQGGPGGF